MTLLWVMTGSALGAMARLWLVNRIQQSLPSGFPWGTLTVNVTGAVLIGLLVGGTLDPSSTEESLIQPLLVIGMLGSYTTVSSFSVQTLALWQARQWQRAAINVMASLILCLGGAALGISVARALP